MQKYINEIRLLTDESELRRLTDTRVEMKGAGPSIQVIRKSLILLTDHRIVIGQKVLFRNKYLVRYMLWLDAETGEKLHFTAGVIETGLKSHNIKALELKGQPVTEFRPGGSIDYIRIFCDVSVFRAVQGGSDR